MYQAQNNQSYPRIIAHRGASSEAPENTRASFQKAINAGAEGLEFDVRLTKDGIPVVFHDASLRRIAQKKDKISDLSISELRKIDIGSWFNSKHSDKYDAAFANERILTLEEFFKFLDGYKGSLYLEMKCKNRDAKPLVEAVAKVVKDSGLLEQLVLKSFKLEAVKLTRKNLPGATTAALFAPKILNFFKKRCHIIEKAEDCKANQLSIHFSMATKKLVEKARLRGFSTVIWTADNPIWVKRAENVGIEAIITNNPERLLNKRRELLFQNSILA
jgi:glycerophosphoryl diester phosphodiesterase